MDLISTAKTCPGMWCRRKQIVRRWRLWLLCVVMFAIPYTRGKSQEPASLPFESHQQRVEVAVEESLRWLASRQNENGSFGKNAVYFEDVGVTSLVGMAFVADGSTPISGRYRQQVSRARDYLLSCLGEDHVFRSGGALSVGPMYGHGYATQFLADIYGMSPQVELKSALERAVTTIVSSQAESGGWRYQPVRDDADVSVTVCQLSALRAVRNAGLTVPQETIERGISYLSACQNVDGGFAYQQTSGKKSEFARSAACIVAFQNSGVQQRSLAASPSEYLQTYFDTPTVMKKIPYRHYGWFYGAQVLLADPKLASKERELIFQQVILDDRDAEGYWREPALCDEYATAMSSLALLAPQSFLPIFAPPEK